MHTNVEYYRDLHEEDVDVYWMTTNGVSGKIQSDDREITISEIKDIIATDLKQDRSTFELGEGTSTIKFFVDNKHHV